MSKDRTRGTAILASRPLDRDKLNMLDRQLAADIAFTALHPIQDKDPEEIVMGSAVLFAAICRRCSVDAGEMYAKATTVLREDPFHKRTNDALQSLQDFAALRVLGDADVGIA